MKYKYYLRDTTSPRKLENSHGYPRVMTLHAMCNLNDSNSSSTNAKFMQHLESTVNSSPLLEQPERNFFQAFRLHSLSLYPQNKLGTG